MSRIVIVILIYHRHTPTDLRNYVCSIELLCAECVYIFNNSSCMHSRTYCTYSVVDKYILTLYVILVTICITFITIKTVH
jgi:hypothetical protein